MRKYTDKRDDAGREIDDFLSQFDRGDDPQPDINSYIDDTKSNGKGAKSSSDRGNNKKNKKSAGNSRKSRDSKKSRDNKKNRVSKGENLLKRILRFLAPTVANPDYDPDQGSTYRVNGKMVKNKPTKFSFAKLVRTIIVACVALVVAFLLYAFAVIAMAPPIDPENIYDSVSKSSTIYDDEGKAVDTIHYDQDRTIIKYEDMPENMINAFVALEDKTFWKHHGFNWVRMAGAVVSSVTGGGSISGTSTITQQLARNVYLPEIKSERSIKRKIIEMYYASVIEKELDKEQIIEAYLNTIYLGFGAYGVDAASHAYFSKDPKDLSLVQCASLAALPQAPDSYALVKYVDDDTVIDGNADIIMREPETYIANDISKDRRDTCLKFMLDQGYITQEQFDKANDKDLIDFIKPEINLDGDPYAYFNDYLISQVEDDLIEKYNITSEEAEQMIYTGGLKIYSTLDSTAQKVIVKEFENDSNFPSVSWFSTDANGNVISDSGAIMLYAYDNFFNNKGNFKLKSDECKVNSDGSLTIYPDYRLNIYTTEYNGITDYSLEFKSTYVREDGTLYIYSGGYINIPAEFKSLDKNGNLVISSDYFSQYEGYIKLGKETATITPKAYSLAAKTIQPQAAMAIVGVGTGEVKALVGGRNSKGRQLFNRALNPRQSGSSIKPISVYAGSIQKSFELASEGKKMTYVDYGHDKQGIKYYGDYLTAASVIVDEKMTFNGKTWPQNAGGGYSGAVTMRKALQNSINVCAVKLELQLGDEYTADMVEKFGITTLDREGDVNDLNPAALALGGLTNGVIPLEMAQAYAAFPNKGVRNTSIAYTKVTDRNGELLLTSESKTYKVLDEGVAFIMTDMLKSVVSQGIGSPARTYGVQAGGKTGTTSQEYDIWFDGFTPTYAASLWIGNDVNLPLTSMSGPAAALWGKIMNQIPNALKGTYPEQPSNVVKSNGEYFTSGTQSGLSNYIQEEKKRKEAEAKKKAEEEAKKKAEEEAKKKEEEANKKPTPTPEPTPTPTPTPDPDDSGEDEGDGE